MSESTNVITQHWRPQYITNIDIHTGNTISHKRANSWEKYGAAELYISLVSSSCGF